MTLGEFILARRKSVGLTQRQLGEAVGREGISAERTVSYWESNTREPSVKDLRPLCRALKCSLEELIPTDK